MNPYESPITNPPAAHVSTVAIAILTFGTIGLSSVAAVLCGISFHTYLGIAGKIGISGPADDVGGFIAYLFLFGGHVLALVCVGVPVGFYHLRRRTRFRPIPIAVYITLIVALVVAGLSNSWLITFQICCILSWLVSARTAAQYQHAFDTWWPPSAR